MSFDEDLGRASSLKEEKLTHKKKKRRQNDREINQLKDNDKKKGKQELLAKTREEVSLSSKPYHFLMLLVFLNVFNKCVHTGECRFEGYFFCSRFRGAKNNAITDTLSSVSDILPYCETRHGSSYHQVYFYAGKCQCSFFVLEYDNYLHYVLVKCNDC